MIVEFEEACRNIRQTQRNVLKDVVTHQASSEMGRAFGLARLSNPEVYRRTMPLGDYESVRPWVDRIRQSGDSTVMFDSSEKLIMFTMTSGSEGEPKHIPVTGESYQRYRRAWFAWVTATVQDHPDALDHGVLPIVSPVEESRTPSGIACGSMSGLSMETQSRFVRSMYGIPAALCGLSNQAEKYYAFARWCAARPVSFLTTANPSTWLMFAQVMNQRREEIIRDVHDGTLGIDVSGESERVKQAVRTLRPNRRRARWLEQIVRETGALRPRDVWPELKIVTNWKGGTLGHYLDLLPEWYGNTPVRDIGLLASEGRMNIPLDDNGGAGPLDIRSHFFEFIPVEEEGSKSPTTLLAHEIEVGRDYFIVLTNFSGLHRYDIQDVVRVEGQFHECPTVRFLHKGSRFSSITGEKLSESQVTTAVRRASKRMGWTIVDFMLVPVWGETPRYALMTSKESLGGREHWPNLLLALEEHLNELNIEYLSKRKSGRLGPISLCVVEPGVFDDMRLERIASSGGRSEQYKPTYLTGNLEFLRGLDILEWMHVDGESRSEPLVRR
jgi:hypothetical protein